MAVDKARRERLARLSSESRALLESLADRLPEVHVEHFRTLGFVGEWGELVEGMCAHLVKGQIPITPSERDALASILEIYPGSSGRYPYSDNSEETLASLNVVEQTDVAE